MTIKGYLFPAVATLKISTIIAGLQVPACTSGVASGGEEPRRTREWIMSWSHKISAFDVYDPVALIRAMAISMAILHMAIKRHETTLSGR